MNYYTQKDDSIGEISMQAYKARLIAIATRMGLGNTQIAHARDLKDDSLNFALLYESAEVNYVG